MPHGMRAPRPAADETLMLGRREVRAGVDSHMSTLAVAVVDDARRLSGDTFAEDPRGHQRQGRWLADAGVTGVGIEGSGHLGRAAGARLVKVGFDVKGCRAGSPWPTPPPGRRRQVRPDRRPGDRPGHRLRRGPGGGPVHRRHDRGPADPQRLPASAGTERIGLVHRVHAYLVVVLPGSKDKVPELTRPTQVRAARGLLHGKSGVRIELIRRRLDRDRPGDRRAQAPSRPGRHRRRQHPNGAARRGCGHRGSDPRRDRGRTPVPRPPRLRLGRRHRPDFRLVRGS